MDSGIQNRRLFPMTIRDVINWLRNEYTLSTAKATEAVYSLLESSILIEQSYTIRLMDTVVQPAVSLDELHTLIRQFVREIPSMNSGERVLHPEISHGSVRVVATFPPGLSTPDDVVDMHHAFSDVISSARHTLRISSPYIEHIGVQVLLAAFETAAQRNVTCHMLIRLNNWNRPEMRQIMALLALYDLFQTRLSVRSFARSLGQQPYQLSWGGIHAKLLISDDAQVYIGSGELRDHALHHNFEVGCVSSEPSTVALASRIFDTMWYASDNVSDSYCRSFIK